MESMVCWSIRPRTSATSRPDRLHLRLVPEAFGVDLKALVTYRLQKSHARSSTHDDLGHIIPAEGAAVTSTAPVCSAWSRWLVAFSQQSESPLRRQDEVQVHGYGHPDPEPAGKSHQRAALSQQIGIRSTCANALPGVGQQMPAQAAPDSADATVLPPFGVGRYCGGPYFVFPSLSNCAM